MNAPEWRLLFTGGRTITDRARVVCALADEAAKLPTNRPIRLVHGACPDGADALADSVWSGWSAIWPGRYLPPERHPAADYPNPLARNLHMVELGADGCCAIAATYRSGTGNCARAARRAGIPTTDYGAPTTIEVSQ